MKDAVLGPLVAERMGLFLDIGDNGWAVHLHSESVNRIEYKMRKLRERVDF
jgi:hypothetical protein